MDNKLLKSIKEIIDPKAFDSSHNKEKVIAVWWYKVSTGELEISTDINAHHTTHFQLNKENPGKMLLAGRVYRHKSVINLVIYIESWISEEVILKIKNKIESYLGIDIDNIVDASGKLLVERKNV